VIYIASSKQQARRRRRAGATEGEAAALLKNASYKTPRRTMRLEETKAGERARPWRRRSTRRRHKAGDQLVGATCRCRGRRGRARGTGSSPVPTEPDEKKSLVHGTLGFFLSAELEMLATLDRLHARLLALTALHAEDDFL